MKACCNNPDDCLLNGDREVALLGNPNAGKTTLFNSLTGSRQQTGNWPGVTVECKKGICERDNHSLNVIDLPGTYSLDYSNVSVDEQIARQYVQDNPDTIYLNIIDASTLERGLYLTTQLRELGVPTIVVLNMMDIANSRGMNIDIERLSTELQCPVIPISLRKDKDINALYHTILSHDFSAIQPLKITYSEAVESALTSLQQTENCTRPQALELLQSPSIETAPSPEQYRQNIENTTGEDLDFLLADARFEHTTRLSKQVVKERGKITRTFSDKLDKWILGSWTGIPIFLVLMYLLFLFAINIGGSFIDFFDLSTQTVLVDGGRALFSSIGLPEWLITLLADGVGGGVQVVATFIPIIGALFLFLTILEESGYMSRAAFVMDHFMRKLGVSGKAFVPLIIGFGCNVPGIMAARTLDSHRERILTVMMAPFMSCGARLAVYALFAAAFFPVGGQNIVFLLYLVGIGFAIMTAFILKKTLLKGDADDFFMELPTYQIPQIKNVLINTWNKLKGFILGAGKIIVIVVAVINIANSLGTDGSFGHQDSEKSVLSATAKVVTPLFQPMGIDEDNWPATVGIITGLLAKEVVVGTLDTLYSKIDQQGAAETEAESSYSLLGGLQEAVATIPANLSDAMDNLSDPLGIGAIDDTTNQTEAAEAQELNIATFGAMVDRFHGKVGAFAYLLFILLYFPCVAATGAMVKEVGKGWATLGVVWSTGLAYAAAVIFYQLATIGDHPLQSITWTAFLLSLLTTAIIIFKKVGDKNHSRMTWQTSTR